MSRLVLLLVSLLASSSALAAPKAVPVEHPIVKGLRLGMEVRDFVGAFSAKEHDSGTPGLRIFFVAQGSLPTGVVLVRCDFKDGKLAYAETQLDAASSRAKTWTQFVTKPVSDHGEPKTAREVVGEAGLTSAILDETAAWADASSALVYGRAATPERNYVVAVAARTYKELPMQLANAWTYNAALRDFGRSFTPAGVFPSEIMNTAARLVIASSTAVIPRTSEAEYVRSLKDSFKSAVVSVKVGYGADIGFRVKAGQVLVVEAEDPAAAKGRVHCNIGKGGKQFPVVDVPLTVPVADGGDVHCSNQGKPGLRLALVAYSYPAEAIPLEYGAHAAAPAGATTVDARGARLDVLAIKNAIDMYVVKHSRTPDALTDLIPNELGTLRRDPWGHLYSYTKNFENYSVASFGPDGLRGGGDDISTDESVP